MAVPIPNLSLSAPSSADTGDSLFDTGFDVSFGNKVTGEDASGGGSGESLLSPLIADLTKGVVVALLARWAWSKFK